MVNQLSSVSLYFELLFREIDFFLVKPLTTISDHSQIITWLNIKSTLSFHKGNELDFSTLKKLPTQFIWDKDSANLFKQALISSRTQTLIADFINCEFPVTEKGIDEAVESFESILHSAASQSLKRKIVKRRRKNTNIITKKWFDKECRLKRNALRKLANEKHRDPTNPDIRELYHSTQKQYQSLIKSKRNKYQAEKCKELEETNTDSSSFWNTLKSMPDTLEPKQIPPISQDKCIMVRTLQKAA